MSDDFLSIIEYVKSAKLKGNVEIINDDQFVWDLGGIYLRFLLDNDETTVVYSKRKSQVFEIGHFHEENCNVINLIQDLNSENKRIHIVIVSFLGSDFLIEDKTKKKKKSWLLAKHYYSEL